MSEQELIEALALRLQDLVTKCGVCAEENMQHAPPQFFVVLAREAVRQMEWARRECRFYDMTAETMPIDGGPAPVFKLKPLTLAPPEWKP